MVMSFTLIGDDFKLVIIVFNIFSYKSMFCNPFFVFCPQSSLFCSQIQKISHGALSHKTFFVKFLFHPSSKQKAKPSKNKFAHFFRHSCFALLTKNSSFYD
jgi:hypothetical protein